MNKAEQILLHSDVLLALRQEKKHMKQQIKESANLINKTTQNIFAPLPTTKNKVSGIGKLISNGIALYQGYRIARGFISAASTIFRRKK